MVTELEKFNKGMDDIRVKELNKREKLITRKEKKVYSKPSQPKQNKNDSLFNKMDRDLKLRREDRATQKFNVSMYKENERRTDKQEKKEKVEQDKRRKEYIELKKKKEQKIEKFKKGLYKITKPSARMIKAGSRGLVQGFQQEQLRIARLRQQQQQVGGGRPNTLEEQRFQNSNVMINVRGNERTEQIRQRNRVDPNITARENALMQQELRQQKEDTNNHNIMNAHKNMIDVTMDMTGIKSDNILMAENLFSDANARRNNIMLTGRPSILNVPRENNIMSPKDDNILNTKHRLKF